MTWYSVCPHLLDQNLFEVSGLERVYSLVGALNRSRSHGVVVVSSLNGLIGTAGLTLTHSKAKYYTKPTN